MEFAEDLADDAGSNRQADDDHRQEHHENHAEREADERRYHHWFDEFGPESDGLASCVGARPDKAMPVQVGQPEDAAAEAADERMG